MSKRRPIAIDLFSGCGGLTVGLKRAGFSVVAAVEINKLAGDTYKANHPKVHLWRRSIRYLTVDAVKKKLKIRPGRLSLLAGCPPCQGFSAMRRLNGGKYVRDERNDLLFDYLRFVRGLRPKTILLENVPGLTSYWRWNDFKNALDRLGYKLRCEVLDAAEYGVPQRRRRLFLVGALKGEIGKARRARIRRTVKGAIGNLPRPSQSRDPLHRITNKRSDRILRLIRRIPKNGGSRLDLGKRSQLDCHRRSDGFKDVYGRMSWNKVAPTMTTGCINPSKGRFLHPSQNRVITLREAAIIQTFPRRYVFSLDRGRFAAAEMIGNALPPEFVARNARPIYSFLIGVPQ